MINRLAIPGNQDAVATARQLAHYAEQNAKSIADGIGRMIASEPNERKRDLMLSPYFSVRRAQHQIARARG
jgi:hypothetical protein